MKRPEIIFVGMETSGALRRRFQAKGYETYSVDLLPSEDGGEETTYTQDGMLTLGKHWVGDVFGTLENMYACDLWPDAAVFHPDCTYLTNSAEWAYKDPDFVRYPEVGYHQRVKPGTLTGAARRAARAAAMDQFRRILALPIRVKVIENPRGALSRIMKPTQTVQPYDFGDDASKATCLWLLGKYNNPLPPLPVNPAKRVPGRIVNGVERWANQTDSGQNRLSPGDDRWKDRARTYPGIADALADYIAEQLS
jgi:hypothetical protein